MSSFILFELVKGVVLGVIICLLIFIERWHKNHPHPPGLHT